MEEASPNSKLARIGPYQLLDTLGSGGMGVVYLAEQKEPVRRRVALKVIKLGMDSEQVLARFELERQALAVMNHPAIAKVFDAGTTEQGQPYFVMELVDGLPLTKYCDENRLSFTERICVFQQVCRGVQHAHQKGILHRDLKPANILVSRKEDQHVVKIIDFGLARATGLQLVSQTIYTAQGQLIGTPEYMSPEQAGGNALDMDTRTDIYSMGVILYELLVGELPFSSADFRKFGLLEIQRVLREEEPPKLISKFSSIGNRAEELARQRGLSVGNMRKVLRGELDWIVMRALAKEPARRYESAINLAMDLGRYLDLEPIEAGPPSAAYRLRKIVQKYRTQVTAGVLVFSSLIVGLLMAWSYAVEAARKGADAVRNRKLFDRVSLVVRLETAKAEMADLYPVRPENTEEIATWLRSRGDALRAELPNVKQTLAKLRERVTQLSDDEKQRIRERHPRYDEFLALLEKKVPALRRAMAVRQQAPQQVPAILAAESSESARVLIGRAWNFIDPGRSANDHGKEAKGLALVRRALVLSTPQDDLADYNETLAWALLANGLDLEAVDAIKQAIVGAAGADDRVGYRQTLLELKRAKAAASVTLGLAEQRLAELREVVEKRTTWSFKAEPDRFLHKTLMQVEAELESFLGPKGALEALNRSRFWATQIEALTRDHPKARVSWDHVRVSLKKEVYYWGGDVYPAIDLSPQTGLVPIGKNPKTGLWEFYHLRSAWDPWSGIDPSTLAIPVHADDGSIKVEEDSGIVFVLLPPARFVMGAQKVTTWQLNYDVHALPDEQQHSVDVSAFFLARHEMTQAQWLRLSRSVENPSQHGCGADGFPIPVDLRHPVENVSWSMCQALLQDHNLVLPSETEWEYACRSGTTTEWSSGGTAAKLDGHANLLDEYGHKMRPDWNGEIVPFDDRRVIHAPVGSYHANTFGMHDMHGNVSEWCQSLYRSPASSRVIRGGSFRDTAQQARSASRESSGESLRSANLGMRAARRLHK